MADLSTPTPQSTHWGAAWEAAKTLLALTGLLVGLVAFILVMYEAARFLTITFPTLTHSTNSFHP